MKRRILMVILLALILATSGCSSGHVERTPIMPVVTRAHELVPLSMDTLPANITESPDDIVFTPGGETYRANVHEQGVADRWPSVDTVEINMVNRWDSIYTRYRSSIVTKPGEIRNDILIMRKEKSSFLGNQVTVELFTTGAPPGMIFSQANDSGLPGTIAAVLNIRIPQDIQPGFYSFNIDLEIDGLPYGSLPCTIEVIP
jgi:hypothetical protein